MEIASREALYKDIRNNSTLIQCEASARMKLVI